MRTIVSAIISAFLLVVAEYNSNTDRWRWVVTYLTNREWPSSQWIRIWWREHRMKTAFCPLLIHFNATDIATRPPGGKRRHIVNCSCFPFLKITIIRTIIVFEVCLFTFTLDNIRRDGRLTIFTRSVGKVGQHCKHGLQSTLTISTVGLFHCRLLLEMFSAFETVVWIWNILSFWKCPLLLEMSSAYDNVLCFLNCRLVLDMSSAFADFSCLL